MNEEIKEILDKLNNKAEHYILYDYEVKQLLDYITNLQEENRLLKMNMLEKQFPDLNAVKVEIETYKSRNEKAIDLLEPLIDLNGTMTAKGMNKLLNILQGEDKDE